MTYRCYQSKPGGLWTVEKRACDGLYFYWDFVDYAETEEAARTIVASEKRKAKEAKKAVRAAVKHKMRTMRYF